MNTFGRIFRTQILGESHGNLVGIVLDGCPAGIALSQDDFWHDLKRRQAGAKGTTPRQESDIPLLQTGIWNGYTTGAPLTILFENNNTKSSDYDKLKQQPRPGHADWVAAQKFAGFNDHRGGGHFSGRLTLPLVAAGVVAKKIVQDLNIQAKLIEAGGLSDIEQAIEQAIQRQDSIGGIVECVVQNMQVGWGEPFFDSLESVLAHLLFSIPAIKGVEFGSGFAASKMYGSQHNDAILDASGKTATNHAGGINGGLSNGNDLIFRVAVKPPSSTPQVQHTYHAATQQLEPLTIGGRHDLCIALRVPPVVEAVTAIALADMYLLHKK